MTPPHFLAEGGLVPAIPRAGVLPALPDDVEDCQGAQQSQHPDHQDEYLGVRCHGSCEQHESPFQVLKRTSKGRHAGSLRL